MPRAIPPPDLALDEFFTRWLPAAVSADPERREQLAETVATLVFDVHGEGGGLYHLRIAGGVITGFAGEPATADLRVRVDLASWRALNAGTLSAPEAFLRRRVQLSGNLFLAVKLHLIIG